MKNTVSIGHTIYIGKTVNMPDKGIFVNYGMTGIVKNLKGVTNDMKIFEVDGTNIHFLTSSC